jgi:hypothetical protein
MLLFKVARKTIWLTIIQSKAEFYNMIDATNGHHFISNREQAKIANGGSLNTKIQDRLTTCRSGESKHRKKTSNEKHCPQQPKLWTAPSQRQKPDSRTVQCGRYNRIRLLQSGFTKKDLDRRRVHRIKAFHESVQCNSNV